MFNFHKPRTYKSAEGCCICRAKTSSSRFTDSRKYERDAMQCFDLKYPRYGEICNACVLLVKRYKRLPIGSKKNWGHVVDARGGPGSNKLQVKYKSERISSRVNNNSTSQSNSIANNSGGANTSSSVGAGGLNFIPEKFNKIFKKSKKAKEPSTSSSPTTGTGKRKSTSHGWSQNPTNNSLPTTPDSMDSDYEDSRLHGALANTVVQFQTQTRASAHRAAAVADARKKALQMGSKRRKCAVPRKNLKNPVYEESMNFFDDGEWQEKKTCCGMVYECAALAGAIIVDFMHYKPCGVHKSSQIKSSNLEEKVKMSSAVDATTSAASNSTATTTALQKSIIATMPSVVQIARPLSTPSTFSTTSSTALAMPTNPTSSLFVASPNTASVSGSNTKPTLALKKHYLYYKRQSECFPQGDNVVTNCTPAITQSAAPSLSVDPLKTEFENNSLMPQQQQESTISNSSIITETPMPNAITCSNNNNTIINNNDSSTSNIIISSSSSSSNNSSNYLNATTPKHSNAKVTTISSPPLITGPCSAGNVNKLLPLGKPQSVLHKIKANEAGKVIKNSLDKSNMAPSSRLKSGDFPDMKHVIKTVDKSYVLAKPIPTTTQTNNMTQINTTQHPYQPLTGNYATTQSLTASLSATSPTSSTSSTSSTKFSDNSSDSGFDENMLDRKSASPLQEDTEKKLLSRPGVQTMFLASGVQIQGQHQNLVFTGNEVAAKILKNRTQQQQHHLMANASMPANTRSLTNNAATSVKIAQIPTTSLMCIGGNVAATVQAKVRTMYNNNNSIQHENGITTIVPASSLAATNQTAAMNNIQPSTVTITPAPANSGSGSGGSSNINKAQYSSNGNGATVHHQQHQNNMTRKLTAATTTNIINLHSNNLVTPAMTAGHTYGGTHANLSNNLNGNQHHTGGGSSIVNNSISNNAASLNQKIILLKTSSNVGATITSSNTKYNNSRTLTTAMNNAPTITGGGGAIGSGVIR